MPLPKATRRRRLWRRRLGFAALLGALLTALSSLPPLAFLDRLGIDGLIPARHALFGPLFPPTASDVVVVAIDEQTYHTPPFAQTPKVAWTTALGDILGAVTDAGATAIGFDIIFPTTLDRPDLLPGRDRPFLVALRRAATAGKLVLGEARLSREVLAPHPAQIIAALGPANLRLLNLAFDPDDVVREYRPSYPLKEGAGSITSFGGELAVRAGARLPPAPFLINFNTGPGDVPVYSLADLSACAAAGDRAYFARQFRGKIVLIGEILDIEDRFRAAKRYALTEGDTSAAPPRCRIAADPDRFRPLGSRSSMAGVLIHAAAINTLTKNIALVPLAAAPDAALRFAWFVVLGLGFFATRPVLGAAVGALALAALGGIAVVAFAQGLVMPVVPLAAGTLLVFAVTYAWRFVVEDGDRRRIQHAFRHYLAPVLVERLAEDPDALRLGGERRMVTILFSDMVGFTSLGEHLADQPDRFVDIVNRYLTVITGAIEGRHGYVDKYIGDAVMAVWGAPVPQANPEQAAVEAALDARDALVAFNADVIHGEFGRTAIGTRVGIACGEAVAGNMGSATRLNYTVIGDVVNLASRLESANTHYGTSLIVTEAVAERLDPGIVTRFLDRVVVKGKRESVPIYEVVGRAGDIDQARRATLAGFAAAVARYHQRDFAGAEAALAALDQADPVVMLYRRRAAEAILAPPPPAWDGRHELRAK